MYKLAAPRSYQYLATFFSIQQTSFAPKNGWGMLVQAPAWLIKTFSWGGQLVYTYKLA